MTEAVVSKLVLTLACAGVVLLASAVQRAAAQGPAPEAKPATQEATPAPTGEGAKPEGAPSAATEGGTPPEGESAPVPLADLTKDGFEIRTTTFVPAEAVTRHSGKTSADAVIVTLQKSTATAVCFYTLKAYVGMKLTTIPACTVHR